MESNNREAANSTMKRKRRQPISTEQDDLLAGYREVADDQQHEAEALEWCDELIGDAMP
jgi:hypothetical protein